MRIATFVPALLVAPGALASSFISVGVSHDLLGPYQSSVASNPGSTLYFEVRFRSDSTTHLGLAGATLQIQIDGWHPSSSLVPWATPQNSAAQGGPGAVGGGALGRLAPFAGAGATELPTTTFAANTLTLGGIGVNNSISIAQLPPALAINSFGSYFNPSLDVAVFRFGVQVGNPSDTFVMTVSPVNILGNEVRWYATPNGSQSTNEPIPPANISPASVFFVPAPGMTTLAALACLAFRRARRE